jgi:hypothetical protein
MWVSPLKEERNWEGGTIVAKWGPATESVSQSTCTPTGQYYICKHCNSFFTNSFIFHAIQQNYFNQSADNPTFQHLKIKDLNPLYQKSFTHKTGIFQGHVQNSLQRVSVHQPLWYLLTPSFLLSNIFS